ncbi:hypothetical protein H5410_001683 [Solanum commersonii]|uniref:Uncharacterized protein n=1 Tax=Solanum commersonii TaxID=4109 RepID=A0A9J6AZP6_SOLCO|nr:hypothetical protein H5410_001683 [Solanum commersonii]
MTHLLQLVTHLLDTCPKLKAYLTCKSIVVTNESSVATGKPYVAACESFGASDDSSVGTNFWFCPNLVWYCNMYPTGKSSVATNDLHVGYTIINY